ncbi:MAG: reverse transcriptase domain-containing protein [Candidatus Pacebacteria bacterium]|nr:reverse transcriptase domain-containing protein [Candidatus Paceibacterota bacterium]
MSKNAEQKAADSEVAGQHAGVNAGAQFAIAQSGRFADDAQNAPFGFGQLPKFTGEDFAGWKKKMRVILMYCGLFDVVGHAVPGLGSAQSSIIDDSDDDFNDAATQNSEVVVVDPQLRRKSEKAFIMILTALKGEEISALVHDVPDGNAHALWSRLERHFESRNAASVSALLAEFHTISQRPTESVEYYIARCKKVVMALKVAGAPVERHSVVFKFVDGLAAHFDAARTAIQATPQFNSMSFDSVCDYMLGQQTRISLRRNAAKAAGATAQAHAAVAEAGTSSGSQSGSSGSKAGVKCFNCGEMGHFSNKCKKPRRPQSAAGAPNKPLCGWCLKGTHPESLCHAKRDNKPRAVQLDARPASNTPVGMLAEAYSAEVRIDSKESPHPGQVWALDSAATYSLATSSVTLQDERPRNDTRICVANGQTLDRPTSGTVVLQTGDTPVRIPNVLKHDRLVRNLLSVSQACASKHVERVVFTRDRAQIIGKEGRILLEGELVGGLYLLRDHFSAWPEANAVVAESIIPKRTGHWHARLYHLAASGIKKLLASKALAGLEDLQSSDLHTEEICNGCIKGKSQRAAFGSSASTTSTAATATETLQCVGWDTLGPMQLPSIGGKMYLLVGVDYASRKYFGFPMKTKGEATQIIIDWCTWASVQQGRPVVELHTDGAAEFVALSSFAKEKGITLTITPPYTPQYNGVNERANRTIVEAARSALHHANAPLQLWAEACMGAIAVRNLTAVRKNGSTPSQIWSPRAKYSADKLRVPFCDGWVHVMDAHRSKLDAKAIPCIFLGIDDGGVYRLFDVATHRVVRSRDVRFDEDSFSQCNLLREQERLASDSVIQPESEQEFSDFMKDSRDNAEMKLAQMLSREQHEKEERARQLQLQPSSFEPIGPSSTLPKPIPAIIPPKSPVQAIEVLKDQPEASIVPSAASSSSSAPSPAKEAPPTVSNTRGGLRDRSKIVPPSKYGMIDWNEVGAMLAQAAAENGIEPKSVYEALSGPEADFWRASIESELGSLARLGTYVPAKLPPGRKAIGTRLVFKKKFGADGKVERYKARLVVQGYAQREGVDYNLLEISAPVLGYPSLRVVLAIVAALDLELDHLDVETAFLNAPMKEEIYIKLPPGLAAIIGSSGTETVYRLVKSLYGCMQAGRNWNEDLDMTIVGIGYTRCRSDTCIYVKTSRSGKPILVPVYVDDIFPAYHREDRAEWLEDRAKLMAKYKMKDLGAAKLVLGMRVTRDRDAKTLKLDQEVYIRKLLESCHMEDCIKAETPEVQGGALSAEASDSGNAAGLSQDATDASSLDLDLDDIMTLRYGSVVGSLLYAAISTRPDISHAVGVLTQFISNPLPAHWHAAKRVLRYLQGTAELGLTFRGDSSNGSKSTANPSLQLGPAYADANWAGDINDRKSTSGLLVKLNGGLVSWKSKKQAVVALSSAEAEYIAAGEAVKEILWLRQLLGEMSFPQAVDAPTLLRGDNKSALAIAQSNLSNARTKHIDIRHHFIRDQIREGKVALEWVSTAEQEADIFTKALGKHPFCTFRDRIMNGVDQAPQAAESGKQKPAQSL